MPKLNFLLLSYHWDCPTRISQPQFLSQSSPSLPFDCYHHCQCHYDHFHCHYRCHHADGASGRDGVDRKNGERPTYPPLRPREKKSPSFAEYLNSPNSYKREELEVDSGTPYHKKITKVWIFRDIYGLQLLQLSLVSLCIIIIIDMIWKSPLLLLVQIVNLLLCNNNGYNYYLINKLFFHHALQLSITHVRLIN